MTARSWFSYDGSPRAQIFRRNHSLVHDLDSMMRLMRYNDFLHDPLSLCKACTPKPNGENAISARSDLNPANGSYPFQALHQRSHGGIDVKVPGSGCCGWGAVRVGGEPQGLLGRDDLDTCPPLTHR